MKQTNLAKKVGISDGFLCELVYRRKNPSWKNAKRLAEATGTSVELWYEGTVEQVKNAIKEASDA